MVERRVSNNFDNKKNENKERRQKYRNQKQEQTGFNTDGSQEISTMWTLSTLFNAWAFYTSFYFILFFFSNVLMHVTNERTSSDIPEAKSNLYFCVNKIFIFNSYSFQHVCFAGLNLFAIDGLCEQLYHQP